MSFSKCPKIVPAAAGTWGMAADFHKSESSNRFDREGEILIDAFRGDRLLGISGPNRDPYVDDRRVGRRFYDRLGFDRVEGPKVTHVYFMRPP
jgi:hypothetical protein